MDKIQENKKELVSVIIPVYNTPNGYINECLKSVLAQTYKNIEIIIIDDGSDKMTVAYLNSLNSDNVHVFRKNQGGVS